MTTRPGRPTTRPVRALATFTALVATAPLAAAVIAAPAEAAAPASLRSAVTAYSDGFLGGQPVKAYRLLSPRCRRATSLSYFTGIVTAANDLYGRLPIRAYRATVTGNRARVTYTYAVRTLNQTREPWVRVNGAWKNNDC